ncbi:hypothetical protein NQZ79_g1573 [Umbelopsis isabellina]|nr:hypothetical protein NQZ79_g1573 [Umbelopsis isabellina]
MSSIRVLKKALRKELAGKLRVLPKEIASQDSKQVTEKLLSLREYGNSQSYCNIYRSNKQRTDFTHTLSVDKACYVPRFTGSTTMTMVKLTSWDDYLNLPMNKWNIPEPHADEVREDALDKQGLDLIIVPGVGFDVERNRIGHGRGYYDRYITKCAEWAAQNNRLPPKTVALALNEQMVEVGRIPLEPTDRKPDVLLTPSEELRDA